MQDRVVAIAPIAARNNRGSVIAAPFVPVPQGQDVLQVLCAGSAAARPGFSRWRLWRGWLALLLASRVLLGGLFGRAIGADVVGDFDVLVEDDAHHRFAGIGRLRVCQEVGLGPVAAGS